MPPHSSVSDAYNMEIILLIALCLLLDCTKPLFLTEQEQLNTLPAASLVYSSEKFKDWKPSPVAENAIFAKARITNIHDYSDNADRMDISATWPHLHLELEKIDGVLPQKQKEYTKIEYHYENTILPS